MLVRRLCVGALCFLASVSVLCGRVSSETGDKQLARVKGVVGYQTAGGAFKPIFGRLDLPDNATAVTRANAAAVLRLKDSSEVDIGENTSVDVSQFNEVSSGTPNVINLNGGALHFNIRHPQGGQSNYRFSTATSQIAVRGTEGYLIAGANGTQVVCVSCAAGDVTVQVGNQSISIVTNQTLTVLGTSPLTATTSITANPTVNNPAVNQFNGNNNPLNPGASGTTSDPTGSLSGAGNGATGAGIGGATAAVGGAAAAAAVVATVMKPGDNSAPAPTPSSTPATVGTLVVAINFPSALSTFPQMFSWAFNQVNATSTATFVCAPANIITCTITQSISPTTGVLSGTVSGTLNAAGAFTVSAAASGYTLPATTFNVYGAVTMSSPATSPIAFTSVPATQTVTVSQSGSGATLSASINCPGGSSAAKASITNGTGPSPLTFTVTAIAASTTTPPPAVACTITVAGQGDGSGALLSIPVNITTTGLGISAHRRKTQ